MLELDAQHMTYYVYVYIIISWTWRIEAQRTQGFKHQKPLMVQNAGATGRIADQMDPGIVVAKT